MELNIYTDGSCSQNSTQDGGWSFVVYNKDNIIHEESFGKKNTTNNEMELLAFLSALEFSKNHKDKKIKIHTDSAYIYNCFEQKWYEKWVVNGWKNAKKEPIKHSEIWRNIFNIFFSNENISILKVKGHSNVQGNIRADFLAQKSKKELSKNEEKDLKKDYKELLK